MKFLIDHQLPPLLAGFLRDNGHESRHVADLGLATATDIELWEIAIRDQWVLVSKDEDFLFLANRPIKTGYLVWVRLGNCRNAALIQAFERLLPDIVRAINAGTRIIEVR